MRLEIPNFSKGGHGAVLSTSAATEAVPQLIKWQCYSVEAHVWPNSLNVFCIWAVVGTALPLLSGAMPRILAPVFSGLTVTPLNVAG